MADRITENADVIVDEMKRKARRRLVGAIVLALAAAIALPMLLEKEPRPLGDDVAVKIPPVDEGKFVNRLTGKSADARPLPKPEEKTEPKVAAAKAEPRESAAAAAPPAAAPASVASAGATADPPAPARKSVAEAEQRALSPSAITAPKPQREAPPPGDAKSALDASNATARPADAEVKPTPITGASPVNPAATTAAGPAVAAPPASAAGAAAAPSAGPAAAATQPKPEGFVVQLAAFADDKGANALANKLKKAGYAAFVEPVQTSRGTLWRVRVGGYPARPDAEAARVKLKAEGYSGIVAPAN